MILYEFPPLGGIGMSRNVRNVQYLPRHGWTPVVLTPRDASTSLFDADSQRLVSESVEIVRTRLVGPRDLHRAAVLVRAASSRVRRREVAIGLGSGAQPRPRAEAAGTASLNGTEAHEGHAPPDVALRIRRLLLFPDDAVGWVPFAIVGAIAARRTDPYGVLFSTSYPISSHLVAGVVKRLTGLPWVAELRDPWLGNRLTDSVYGARPWLHRRLQFKIERWIARTADRLVCVTPSLARVYQQRYPAATVVLIPNGYDRSEILEPGLPRGASERFRIVYTGTLDRPGELRVFLEGVQRALDQRPTLAHEVDIAFYGFVTDESRAVADRMLRSSVLAGVIRFHGFVPRRVAVQALADADAGLVLLGPGPGMRVFVSGKLYDCIGQSKQVLAMVPPGDARDLLTTLGWGVIADPEPASVADAIERLLATPRTIGPADPDGRYDRAVLAGLLADTLSNATGKRESRGDGAIQSR
jgi:glycosyltransferase involved in cell wall biosynthesis